MIYRNVWIAATEQADVVRLTDYLELLDALKALVAVGCLGVITDMAAYTAAWDAIPALIAKAEGA